MELNNDELSIAKSIVISIIDDGAKDAYINGSEEQQKDLMFAYLDHAIKKIEKFQTMLLTNTEARKAFIERVFSIL